jgi:hypothetical protein
MAALWVLQLIKLQNVTVSWLGRESSIHVLHQKTSIEGFLLEQKREKNSSKLW